MSHGALGGRGLLVAVRVTRVRGLASDVVSEGQHVRVATLTERDVTPTLVPVSVLPWK